MSEQAGKNTDKEIWRKVEGDYYSPSIHVTESGGIGIDVGGIVIVKPIEDWHSVMFNFMDGFKMRLGKASLAGKVIAIDNLPTVEELDTFLRNQEVATVVNIFELAQSIRALIESKAEEGK